MDQDRYGKIKAFTGRHLIGTLKTEVEDCTQYIAMRVIENPKANWYWCLVDWLRENGYTQEKSKRGMRAIGVDRSFLEFNPEQNAPATYAMDGDFDKRDLDRLAKDLPIRLFEVLRLRAEGVSVAEIGAELNVTGSRVSQMLKLAIKKVQKRQHLDGAGMAFNESLSRAENDVFKLLLTGLSNKEIADKLFVTDKTVRFHLTTIYSKLGVSSRSECIAKYSSGYLSQLGQPTTPKTNPEEDDSMADWQPMTPSRSVALPTNANQAHVIQKQDAQDHVTFIVDTFKINQTIDDLQVMSKEVTKGDYSVEKVMAACQCIGRMNETIQTVMKAAQVLRGR